MCGGRVMMRRCDVCCEAERWSILVRRSAAHRFSSRPRIRATRHRFVSSWIRAPNSPLCRTGRSALAVAVLGGDAKTVELLLEAGSLNQPSQLRPLIETAANQGHSDVCELLLKHSSGDKPLGRALNRALLAQKPEIAIRLIRQGASLDRLTSDGKVPPIVLASYTEVGDTSVTKMMLERNVDLSKRNKHGETALTWARRRGHARADRYAGCGRRT